MNLKRRFSTIVLFVMVNLSVNICYGLTGDVNHDYEVNLADLELVSSYWLQDPNLDPVIANDPTLMPDIDNSGKVDLYDYAYLSKNWGMNTFHIHLEAYWPFDDDTDDYSYNGHDATPFSSPNYTTGKLDNLLPFQ